MDWFRVYHDIIDDPKILRLEPSLRWFYVALISVCSRCNPRGSLPDVRSISLHLRLRLDRCERVVNELIKHGLIDEDQTTKALAIHGWNNRQCKSDDSYERVKRFRNVSSNDPGNVSETVCNGPPLSSPLNPPLNNPPLVSPLVSPREQNPPSSPPRGKFADLVFLLPEWIDPPDWADYVGMRKAIKKPMTPRACQLAIKTLERLRTEGHQPAAVLQQSILNSWQGLFPIRPDHKPGTNGKPQPPKLTPTEYDERQRQSAANKARVAEINRQYREQNETPSK